MRTKLLLVLFLFVSFYSCNNTQSNRNTDVRVERTSEGSSSRVPKSKSFSAYPDKVMNNPAELFTTSITIEYSGSYYKIQVKDSKGLAPSVFFNNWEWYSKSLGKKADLKSIFEAVVLTGGNNISNESIEVSFKEKENLWWVYKGSSNESNRNIQMYCKKSLDDFLKEGATNEIIRISAISALFGSNNPMEVDYIISSKSY